MNCRNCPYICEDYARKEDWFIEKGYVIEEYNEDIYRSCYCDKIGGKIGLYGFCGDANFEQNEIPETYLPFIEKSDRQKAIERRKNDIKHKKKLERQAKTLSSYPGIAYPITKDGNYAYDESEIAYYKKVYKSSHADRYRYYKKASNKKVRREKEFISNQRGFYKKIFDYWWSVY